eukprot:2594552-Alexandrium_andersonii.AAC.1
MKEIDAQAPIDVLRRFMVAAQAAVAEDVFTTKYKDAGLAHVKLAPFESKAALRRCPQTRAFVVNFYGQVARVKTATSFPLRDAFGQTFYLGGSQCNT